MTKPLTYFECADCGLGYEANRPDAQEGDHVYCQACWESRDDYVIYEAQEEPFEPDLIGSQWYWEDLP